MQVARVPQPAPEVDGSLNTSYMVLDSKEGLLAKSVVSDLASKSPYSCAGKFLVKQQIKPEPGLVYDAWARLRFSTSLNLKGVHPMLTEKFFSDKTSIFTQVFRSESVV